MTCRRFARIAFVLCVSFLASSSEALTFTLEAIDSGWFDQNGNHTSSYQNYAAGWEDTEVRNFFVFDVSGLPAGESVLSATFRAYNPAVGEPDVTYSGGYDSPDSSETYHLVEVSTPAALFGVSHLGTGLTVYADLADGPIYGTALASAADNGQFIEIPLSAAGVAALDAAVLDFVLGGFAGTLDSVFGAKEIVWGNSDPQGFGPYQRQLVVTTTPEPGSGALLALGLFALRAAHRTRVRRIA